MPTHHDNPPKTAAHQFGEHILRQPIECVELDGEGAGEVAGGVADAVAERRRNKSTGFFGDFQGDVLGLDAVGAEGQVFAVFFDAADGENYDFAVFGGLGGFKGAQLV